MTKSAGWECLRCIPVNSHLLGFHAAFEGDFSTSRIFVLPFTSAGLPWRRLFIVSGRTQGTSSAAVSRPAEGKTIVG